MRYMILVLSLLLLFTGCWDFLSINQQDLADTNSSFDVPITLSLTPEGEGGTGYFGILLPIGWTAGDSISYNGVHNGTFLYTSTASASMDSFSSAPVGYYWWVCEGDTVDSLCGGTVSLTPRIFTDNQTGTFFIDYMITNRFDGYFVCCSGYYPISVEASMTATVTTTDDSRTGSLRQALAEVSSSGEILFDLSYPATIVLDSQLVIDRNVTITGPDSGELTISGNDMTRVFYVNENLKSVNMSKLKISHGKNDWSGGGIYCVSSDLCLTDVNITNNSAEQNGGGIYCYYSNQSLSNVTISNNSAGLEGGGLACDSSDLALSNVTVSNNLSGSVYEGGGGIYLRWGSTVSFVNSILWYNLPQEIYFYGYSDSNYITITYSDVQGGLQGIVTNNNGSVYWLNGNIDADPMFVDTAEGNYSLQAGSPCIDAGIQDTIIIYNNGQDTLFVPAIAYNGNAPDMGAHESPYISAIKENKKLPNKFVLRQNYPNPFNPSTTIEFAVPKTSNVTLNIFNILGEELATLVSDRLSVGSYSFEWDAGNLASGVYMYRLQAGDYIETRKMVVMR